MLGPALLAPGPVPRSHRPEGMTERCPASSASATTRGPRTRFGNSRADTQTSAARGRRLAPRTRPRRPTTDALRPQRGPATRTARRAGIAHTREPATLSGDEGDLHGRAQHPLHHLQPLPVSRRLVETVTPPPGQDPEAWCCAVPPDRDLHTPHPVARAVFLQDPAEALHIGQLRHRSNNLRSRRHRWGPEAPRDVPGWCVPRPLPAVPSFRRPGRRVGP
jgi:hypothetical protein